MLAVSQSPTLSTFMESSRATAPLTLDISHTLQRRTGVVIVMFI